MSFHPRSGYRIPGAFTIDSEPSPVDAALWPPLAAVGVHPGVFRRPPLTVGSAASSGFLVASSTASSPLLPAAVPALGAKRKRRNNEDDDLALTPLLGPVTPISAAGPRMRAFVPLVHWSADLGDSAYSDVEYRRALGPATSTSSPAGPSPVQGRDGPSWTTHLTIESLGGVITRVWDFCASATFRGFFAGGGGGASASSPSEPLVQVSAIFPRRSQYSALNPFRNHDSSPSRDYGGGSDSSSDSRSDLTSPLSRPAVKRRQISSDKGDDLRRNWIMVNEEPTLPAWRQGRHDSLAVARRHATSANQCRPTAGSTRRASRLSTIAPSPLPPLLTRRHSHRVSHAGSPSLSAREPASFAPTHAPPSRVPTQSQSQPPLQSHRRGTSLAHNPAASLTPPMTVSRRRADSCASTASSRVQRTTIHACDSVSDRELDGGGLTPEARRLATQKLRGEQEASVRISTMNSQLRQMIRECREALGTRVDVDTEDGTADAAWLDED